jgi:hypothetical protein
MYRKPTLERFGTFRELTRFGSNFTQTDLLSMGGTTQDDSCNPAPDDTYESGFGCPAASRGSR